MWEEIFEDAENETFKRAMSAHKPKLNNGIIRIIHFIKSDYNLCDPDKNWMRKFVPNIVDEIEKVEAQKLLNAAEYKSNKIDVFMKKILGNFPTSEAAVERGFSKHKAIHGKFRANLEESLVEKILFVRENKMFNTPDEKPTDEVDEMLDFDDCEL